MRRERRAQTAERGGRRDGDVAYPDAADAGHAAAVHGHEDRALPHRRRRRGGGYARGPTRACAGQHARLAAAADDDVVVTRVRLGLMLVL